MAQVGAGTFTYTRHDDYPKLPAGESMGIVSRVATDAQHRLYVFQRKDPPVLVFDRDGSFLKSWGAGVFTDPHGLKIAGDLVYTTDRRDHVARIFTLDGKLVQMIGRVGAASDTGVGKSPYIVKRAAGPFNQPTDIMPAPNGDLYATDGYGNCRVHRFSADGQLRASWGQPGSSEPGQFHLVHGIAIAPDGTLYICDRTNRRIQIFSADGEFRGMWTGMGGPNDIARDSEGNFYICEQEVDHGPAHICIRDGNGSVLARWETRHAHGLTVDAHGDIYVALSVDHHVDKYVRLR